jgi:hypothetical protein
MQDFSTFLDAFKDAIVLMSGSEYSMLGIAIPIYFSVTQHAKSAIAAKPVFRSAHTINFAQSVLLKLIEYDGRINKKITRIATALDPQEKSFLPAQGIIQVSIEDEIRLELDYTYQSIYDAEQARSASTSASSSSAKLSATATFMNSLMAALQVPSRCLQGSIARRSRAISSAGSRTSPCLCSNRRARSACGFRSTSSWNRE